VGTQADGSRQLLKDVLSSNITVQAGLLLTRKCALPRMTHIVRAMPPRITAEGVRHFDCLVRQTVRNKLQIRGSELEEHGGAAQTAAAELIHAPYKHAGLGFRAIATTMHAAYWASLSSALSEVRMVCGTVEEWGTTQQYHDAVECLVHLRKVLTRAAVPLLPADNSAASIWEFAISKNSPCVAGYQQKIMEGIEALDHKKRIDGLPQVDIQRITCASGKNCSLWLDATPTEPSLRLSDMELTLAVRGRLGLPRAHKLPAVCAACKRTLTPAHFHSCRTLRRRGVTNRHDYFLKCVVKNARLAGMLAYEEQPLRDEITHTRTRPDGVLLSAGYAPLQFDVSFVSMESDSYIQRDEDSIIAARARSKSNKYAELCARQGSRFLPMVVSSHGAMHTDADRIVDTIIAAHYSNTTNVDKSFGKRLRSSLSVCIQRGNARADVVGLIEGTDGWRAVSPILSFPQLPPQPSWCNNGKDEDRWDDDNDPPIPPPLAVPQHQRGTAAAVPAAASAASVVVVDDGKRSGPMAANVDEMLTLTILPIDAKAITLAAATTASAASSASVSVRAPRSLGDRIIDPSDSDDDDQHTHPPHSPPRRILTFSPHRRDIPTPTRINDLLRHGVSPATANRSTRINTTFLARTMSHTVTHNVRRQLSYETSAFPNSR
jgi:hypothetical protein